MANLIFDKTQLANMKKTKSICIALSHPLRIKMMDIIEEEKSINVTNLYNKMNLVQSVTSQHLKLLKNAGVVSSNKVGKERVYKLNKEYINKVNILCSSF